MSKVVRKEQCPICQDSGCDNLAVYDDGTTYCFACSEYSGSNPIEWAEGKTVELPARKLTLATCQYFDYQVGRNKFGQPIHIANFYNASGKKVLQKLRTKDKKFTQIGGKKELPLFGQWKYSPNPNISIIVTEGEIDAMSVAQATEFQRPVVSLVNGASNAKRDISNHLAWLSGFKYVVLAFDNDEAGRKATEQCIELFEHGKVRTVEWVKKDANEHLLANEDKIIRDCIIKAREFKPDRIVSPSDIMDRILERPTMGMDWPWPSMTKVTYGFQTKEIYIIVAANGIGKTEMVKDIAFHLMDHNIPIGIFSFEQSPEDTMRRLVGAKISSKLHLPGEKWDSDEIRRVAESFQDKVYLYDKAGSADDQDVMRNIHYLAKAKGVKLVIIDNLKGLGGHGDMERMTNNMRKFQAMKNELDISIILLSHVAKDKIGRQAYVSTSPKRKEEYEELTAEDVHQLVNKAGLEWESGRMPTKENVEGASAVVDLADYVFALSRNSISKDELEKKTTIVKVLKARRDGSMNGTTFKLVYTDQGRLVEGTSTISMFGGDAF